MNLLFLSDNYPPEMNANARIVSELAHNWTAAGHEVTVITSHPNFPQGKLFPGYKNVFFKKEKDGKVDLWRVKTYMAPNQGFSRRILDFLSFMFMSFFVGLRDKKSEVIIAISPQFFTMLSGGLLSIFKRKPFVIILCDLWPDAAVSLGLIINKPLLRFIKKLEFWLYKKANLIICLSPYYKNYLIEGNIPPEKISVSISGVDTTKFYPRSKDSELCQKYNLSEKYTLGYCGTFGISQDFECFFYLKNALQTKGISDIKFVLIGDGAQKKNLKTISLADPSKQVIVDGPVPGNEMPLYWSILDIALVTLKDNLMNRTVIPSKILEAMAMSKPVILYAPEGEAQKFVEHSQGGIFVKMGNLSLLYDSLMKLYMDKTYYFNLSANALAFSQQYARTKQAQALQEQFQELISSK